MKVFLITALLCSFVAVSLATYGVDVSQATYPSAWKCLRERGFSFGVIRAYQSTGHADPVGPHTVYNAWAGGMSHVDVYMFPCPRCSKSAATQVREAVENLRRYNCNYGMFWFDIEGSQYWMSVSQNRKWLEDAIAEAQRLNQHIGVYTSYYQWSSIMGTSYSGAKHFPLWYAHYDDHPSFSDFRPFGGWTKASIKQYYGDAVECGVGIDKNWYP